MRQLHRVETFLCGDCWTILRHRSFQWTAAVPVYVEFNVDHLTFRLDISMSVVQSLCHTVGSRIESTIFRELDGHVAGKIGIHHYTVSTDGVDKSANRIKIGVLFSRLLIGHEVPLDAAGTHVQLVGAIQLCSLTDGRLRLVGFLYPSRSGCHSLRPRCHRQESIVDLSFLVAKMLYCRAFARC